jgi:hypothetical protein
LSGGKLTGVKGGILPCRCPPEPVTAALAVGARSRRRAVAVINILIDRHLTALTT